MEKLDDFIALDPDTITIETDSDRKFSDIRKIRDPEVVKKMALSLICKGQINTIEIDKKGRKHTVITGTTRVLGMRLANDLRRQARKVYEKSQDADAIVQELGLGKYVVNKMLQTRFLEASIQCKKVRGLSAIDARMRQLEENLQRRDLSVIEEAEQINTIYAELGCKKAVAEALRMSVSVVSKRLSLLDLPEILQDAIHNGMAQNKAMKLAELDEEQMIAIIEGKAKMPKESRQRAPTKKKIRDMLADVQKLPTLWDQMCDETKDLNRHLMNDDETDLSERVKGQIEFANWILTSTENAPKDFRDAATVACVWEAQLEADKKKHEDYQERNPNPGEDLEDYDPTKMPVDMETSDTEEVAESEATKKSDSDKKVLEVNETVLGSSKESDTPPEPKRRRRRRRGNQPVEDVSVEMTPDVVNEFKKLIIARLVPHASLNGFYREDALRLLKPRYQKAYSHCVDDVLDDLIDDGIIRAQSESGHRTSYVRVEFGD